MNLEIIEAVEFNSSMDSSDGELEPRVRCPRIFKRRTNYLLITNDNEFKKRFRLSKNVVVHIIKQI